PLKNLYGTLQISDKAIRAASNNAGAFASLLSGEMQNLIKTAQANLNGMLYGNGKKFLGYADEITMSPNQITLPARFLGNFAVGDKFEVFTAGNDATGGVLTVTGFSGGKISFTGTHTVTNQDRLYMYSADDESTELNGIDSIFRKDAIYNLPVSSHAEILPYTMDGDDTTLEVLNENQLLKFFDNYEEHCQGTPADILLTHPTVRRALFEDLRNLRTNIDAAELAGGFRGFSFNGIPVYSDIKCKGGTLYALNSDSWAIHQLCDWTWLSGEEGGVLKQMDGKAGYIATLVKYADLLCDKPFIQGKASNYSATKVN
ncbi:MAG: phage major capsid protein, partial [Christensenellaceae bacterium]|nr:phage major capsid protein [Christensenellaceae bacterium]